MVSRNIHIVTKMDYTCQIKQYSSKTHENLQTFVMAEDHSSPENLFQIGGSLYNWEYLFAHTIRQKNRN
ncbi:hypothetical protein Bca101_086948 [Brassica carinata]